MDNLALKWEEHCVRGEPDLTETRRALSRVPQLLHDDCHAAFTDAKELVANAASKRQHTYFVLIPAADASESEAATLRTVVEHCIGERWHAVIGTTGLVVRSAEQSQAVPKSVFTLLCDVLDGRAPPVRFGTLTRVPLAGVVWFSIDTNGSDPGLFASWSCARDELDPTYHDRCPHDDESLN